MKFKKTLIILISLFIILSFISSVNAEKEYTWYVSENADPSGDGSINNPFKTLEEGLDKSKSGDSIYLYNGNYKLYNYNITKTINITGEDTNKTIIDGTNTHQRLITIDNKASLNLEKLTLANVNIIPEQETGGAILIQDGTLIINNCNLLNNSVKYGGAIYNYDGIAYIYNSLIQDNYALTYSGCDGGAGIYNLYGTNYIYNTIFNNNTCKEQQGAGIYNNKGYVTLINSTFTNNKGTDSGCGGAIYCNDRAYTTILNCKFINNSAWLGGAIYTANGMNGAIGYTNIYNTIFDNNTARSNGGAIYNYWEMSILTIENSTFTNNKARSGGSIYNQWATMTLKNNTIINSTAKIVGNEIYNNGRIEEITITILNNKTIQTKLNETIEIKIKLTDDNGNTITGGNLTIKGNNKTIFSIKPEEETINYNYTITEDKILLSGNYTPTIKTNLKTSILTTETIIKTTLTGENLTINYGEKAKYIGKLTNTNNIALENQEIQLNITRLTTGANKIYTVKTNTTGEYEIPINLAEGNYTIKAKYIGNETYQESQRENTITIKEKTTLSINEYIGTVRNPNYLKGELTSKNTKIINAEIQITIVRLSNNLNKTYTVKTNNNGEYQLQINLAQGQYKVYSSFTGTNTYSPSQNETNMKITL